MSGSAVLTLTTVACHEWCVCVPANFVSENALTLIKPIACPLTEKIKQSVKRVHLADSR